MAPLFHQWLVVVANDPPASAAFMAGQVAAAGDCDETGQFEEGFDGDGLVVTVLHEQPSAGT